MTGSWWACTSLAVLAFALGWALESVSLLVLCLILSLLSAVFIDEEGL